MRIQNTLQTNGTLLDEDWCRFFKKHHFLIGISIDGPGQYHDAFRVDKGGRGGFEHVLRGWRFLQAMGVETNVLCSVHAANQDHPLDVYRFFRDELKAQFIQFIPIVERWLGRTEKTIFKGWKRNRSSSSPTAREIRTGFSVNPHKLGGFLIAIFEEWVRHDVGKIFIQMFDTALGSWLGRPGGLCIFAPICGTALALEHNGDLYSCDHFVEPEYLLGNIQHSPMSDLVTSEKQRRFGLSKRASLPRYCLDCEVLFACNGGCPKDRIMKTPDGQLGLNYLCPGYRDFFNHIARPMKMMADLFRQGHSPADIMSFATGKQQYRT
jgi:uncharacterized protein